MSETALKKFIRVVDSFIQMAIRLCPEESSIKMGYEKFKLVALGTALTPAKPRFAWQLFMAYVYPMREMILGRNEDFFLNRDIQSDEANVLEENGVDANDAFQSVLNLKDAWRDRISAEDKEKIWRALSMMIQLAEQV